MSKHATWHVGMQNGHNACNIYAYTGAAPTEDEAICTVYGIYSNQNVKACKDCPGTPNAHLIAAAPEAIEACRFIKAFLLKLEHGCDPNDPMRNLRNMVHESLHKKLDAALKKARVEL